MAGQPLLDQLVSENQSQATPQERLLKLLHKAAKDQQSQKLDEDWLEATAQSLVVDIDERLGELLEQIIQHPSFKQLEALWRNTWALVDKTYPPLAVRIRLLDISWPELCDDLNFSYHLVESVLYQKIYQREFNTSGGHPFGLLVIDHPVTTELDTDSGHDDLYTLQLLGELGREALCPMLLPVAEAFMGSQDPDLWTDPQRLERVLHSQDFKPWQDLRQQSVSQFLGLCLPATRVRPPWRRYTDQFLFEEQAAYDPGSETLWGNCAFALARNVLREFCRISWFGFLRSGQDPGTGGAVVDLFPEPKAALKITPALEQFFSQNGFIPLVSGYLDESVAFFSNRPVFQAKDNSDDQVISMLQTTLLGCRIGHYLKMLIRTKVGSYKTTDDCEKELNSWLQQYTSNVEHAEEHILARYPLKRSAAKVQDTHKSGHYSCQVSLQPQYQFDYLNTHILLSTDLSMVTERSTQVSRGTST